ncbi:MAG: CDP-glucose 4,6-dehydratase [Planctomycetota bacterium]|nr:MAG: CDP-glucose 4,6-dehydratase [Planctomycetota bacterium]
MRASAFARTYGGKRVFITGHTGFKGSWLAFWLANCGAEAFGFALPPDDDQRLFDQLQLDRYLAVDRRADVRDAAALASAVEEAKPDFVFHLAAQPLVRPSYESPAETFAVNVQGVVNLLEAIRVQGRRCVVVVVTTDKCYENREHLWGYREDDPLGGHDPYSASKACAEIAASAYRRSFFSACETTRLASARAGNVIGGGDWSRDRIVPDCIRALRRGEPIPVRNKVATRPWQHVLEPLSGYLWLAATMAAPGRLGRPDAKDLCHAFNFGPELASNRTVAQLVDELLKHCAGTWRDCSDPAAVHEAGKLNLAIDKAHHVLGWRPSWNFAETVARTAQWYAAEARAEDLVEFTARQIADYETAAQAAGNAWTQAT